MGGGATFATRSDEAGFLRTSGSLNESIQTVTRPHLNRSLLQTPTYLFKPERDSSPRTDQSKQGKLGAELCVFRAFPWLNLN